MDIFREQITVSGGPPAVTAPFGAPLSAGQHQALAELARIESLTEHFTRRDDEPEPDEDGWIEIHIAMHCDDTSPAPGGVKLEDREWVNLSVPPDYPFRPPTALTEHTRFAGLPHVQWGRSICLYEAANDWDASEGMRGFLGRLAAWYLAAAAGVLQDPGMPWHPPVAYATTAGGVVVLAADIPAAAGESVVSMGVVIDRGRDRLDVVGWLDLDAAPEDPEDLYRWAARYLREISSEHRNQPAFLAPMIRLAQPLGFEYPSYVSDLLGGLDDQGIDGDWVVRLLAQAADWNRSLDGHDRPLLMLVAAAAPAGSDRTLHVAAWRVHDDDQAVMTELDQQIDEGLDDAMIAWTEEWLRSAELDWALTFDRRTSTTQRRDAGRPAQWLAGRRVLLLGCGALGAPIAEFCVRAGVGALHMVDYGLVHPGLLIRQPYVDSDVGLPKLQALAARLDAIGTDAVLTGDITDASRVVSDDRELRQFDLIIDATANRNVAQRLERTRWTSHLHAVRWPPILSVVVGHRCERGVATLAMPGARAAGADIFRRLARERWADQRLADVVDDLLPDPPRAAPLRPEPGCSHPTFAGSAADATAMSAFLLTAALTDLCADRDGPVQNTRYAYVTRLGAPSDRMPAAQRFGWPNDPGVHDPTSGYEIRFDPSAIEQMRAHSRTAFEMAGGQGIGPETGGVLLGQVDHAARVLWVSVADGPPPGTSSSAWLLNVNLASVADQVRQRCAGSHGTLRFVGLWHTHPGGAALPSVLDERTMAALLDARGAPPSLLLLIAGEPTEGWSSWTSGTAAPNLYSRICFP